MIKGVHALFYSEQTDELRAFIKDKLQLPYTDVGEGWLIFDLKEGDVGCHPTEGDHPSGMHNVSFYCDDLEQTVAELSARGVVFDHEIQDHGYGLVTHITMPGGVQVQIYQPKYVKRADKPAARKAPARRRPAARRRTVARKADSRKPPAKRGRRTRR